MRDKLIEKERIDLEKYPRYKTVLDALEEHQKKFDARYAVEDFYNIASFQHQISGREKTESTGGTGLTTLIRSLEQMSEAHQCYMLSGNRIINFKHDFLEYDSESWIGFNSNNDFRNDVPDKTVIGRCPIFSLVLPII